MPALVLAVHVVETGCRAPVPGAGAVSWLCTWWKQVAGGLELLHKRERLKLCSTRGEKDVCVS